MGVYRRSYLIKRETVATTRREVERVIAEVIRSQFWSRCYGIVHGEFTVVWPLYNFPAIRVDPLIAEFTIYRLSFRQVYPWKVG